VDQAGWLPSPNLGTVPKQRQKDTGAETRGNLKEHLNYTRLLSLPKQITQAQIVLAPQSKMDYKRKNGTSSSSQAQNPGWKRYLGRTANYRPRYRTRLTRGIPVLEGTFIQPYTLSLNVSLTSCLRYVRGCVYGPS
jgi:hypothetical protein